eukprot:gnl/TRDRNA2_/TRDRNA2_170317_c0_seq5.p1 gnl/TRDRNA2_/TRDRNA2_170317_c0~~gnl/TRDRNA2_/TRDRNA2_170317_c0_seq5.p1  ORF type:complete len:108 (+),score=25.55 gnl/TRDRNA2_/TRDRNA2_170317_c0_seq5:94-417(+)
MAGAACVSTTATLGNQRAAAECRAADEAQEADPASMNVGYRMLLEAFKFRDGAAPQPELALHTLCAVDAALGQHTVNAEQLVCEEGEEAEGWEGQWKQLEADEEQDL